MKPLILFRAFTVGAILLTSARLAAADDPLADLQKSLHLSLRQGIADKNMVEKPATFQWVHTAGESDSSSIDMGLTFWIRDDEHWNIAPALEYHRQTLTAKKQDNFQGGLTIYNITGDVTQGLATNNQATITWKDDRINTGSAALTKVTCTLLDPKLDIGLGSAISLGSLKVLWQPTGGLQYESAENVRKSGQSGKTAHAYANLEVGFYPWAKELRDRFEIVVRKTAWRNFSASSAFARLYDRTQTLFNGTVTYYFDPNKHIGLGLDYVNGQNPEQGLQKQESTTLSLKLKI